MAIEARSAGDAVRRQLDCNAAVLADLRGRLAKAPPTAVITCARGSSDHAATYLRYILETKAGLLTASLAPSVASLYDQWPSVANALCVAISQSGSSSDILAAVDGYRRRGVGTVALVNDCGSKLAQSAECVVPLCAGTERSVAATKSFIASLAASLQLANCIRPGIVASGEIESLPEKLGEAAEIEWLPLIDCLVEARGLYVIGRGMGLGVASEAALKFKETCSLHAEAYSAAEVRHGPMALFDVNFPVLIFRQEDASSPGVDELGELAVSRGCKVFTVGGRIEGGTTLPTIASSPLLAPILQIQTFYNAVNQLSLARGCDPDCPPLLRKVTVTL